MVVAPPVARAVSMEPPSSEDTSVSLALGVLAAQVSTSARRMQQQIPLDAMDHATLATAQELMSVAADAVEFAYSRGGSGHAPSNFHALTCTVETALETVDDDEASAYFAQLADALARMQVTVDQDAAEVVAGFFTRLADHVTRSVGSSGESYFDS
jgi:hypothetical protein